MKPLTEAQFVEWGQTQDGKVGETRWADTSLYKGQPEDYIPVPVAKQLHVLLGLDRYHDPRDELELASISWYFVSVNAAKDPAHPLANLPTAEVIRKINAALAVLGVLED